MSIESDVVYSTLLIHGSVWASKKRLRQILIKSDVKLLSPSLSRKKLRAKTAAKKLIMHSILMLPRYSSWAYHQFVTFKEHARDGWQRHVNMKFEGRGERIKVSKMAINVSKVQSQSGS